MRRVLYVRVGAWAAALLLGTSAANGASKRLPQSIQTPNETAAPALTGTITQYPTFPLRVSKTFQTIWAERYFSTTSGLGGIGTDPLLNSLLTISYNARTGVYTLKDTADSETMSATFRPTSRTTQGPIDYYRTSSPTATDELQLYNNVRLGTSATGAPVKLTYLSYGAWSHDNLTTGTTWERYFLFGYPTASRDMPLSGTASYSTAVSANVRTEIPSAGDAMLRGSATFTANFAQGIVNTSLTLAYSDSISYAYSGSGPISASSFSGPFSSSTDPYFNLGSFAGSFYGPKATEMGYVFAIERGEADPYAGASVAPPLSWIVGAVVGKKN
jgi:hypothetical protein